MAIIILGMGFVWCSLSQAQVGGIGGMGGVGGIGGGGSGEMGVIPGGSFESATDPSAVRITEGFRVVPTITVGQRYDSNVFFAPNASGLDRDDFVTTASPQVRGLFAGNLVSVNSRVGATGQYFAKHNGLNNVSPNAAITVDASKLVARLWPGARFTVEDLYTFTPEPPAFLTGNLDTQEANPLVRGFQVGRVNTHSNAASVSLGVPLSLTVDLTARYANYLTHFGESQVQQAGVLLDTMLHTYMVGLAKKISLQDTVSASFFGSYGSSNNAQSYTAYGGLAGWDHRFNQTVTLRSTAGVQQVNGQFGSGASNIAPGGSLSVLWSDSWTSWRLSYNVGLTPSLQFVGRPILSQAVSLTVIQKTSIPDLSAFVGLNYGRGNELGGGASSPTEISFTSYNASGGMSYRVTSRTFVVLTYNYLRFDNRFGQQKFELDRHVAQLVLTQAFY